MPVHSSGIYSRPQTVSMALRMFSPPVRTILAATSITCRRKRVAQEVEWDVRVAETHEE